MSAPSLAVALGTAVAVWLALTARPRPPARLTDLHHAAATGATSGASGVTAVSSVADVSGPARTTGATAGGDAAPPLAPWARSALVAVGVGLAAGLVGGPVIALAAAAAALAAGRLRAARRQRRQADHVAAAVPDLVELLMIGLAAGHHPRQALLLAADLAPEVLQGDLARLAAALDRGARFHHALGDLASGGGEPLRPLVSALVAHERDGVPLRNTLDRLGTDARRQRRHRAELAVRRLPVRLSFPLVGCTLTAFALLTVAPLVLAAVRSLDVALP